MRRTLHSLLHDLLQDEPDLWAAALQVLLLAVVVVPGSVPWAGPVLLVLTDTHGVHASDLLVVLLGLLVAATAAQRGLVGDVVRRLLPRAAAGAQRLPRAVGARPQPSLDGRLSLALLALPRTALDSTAPAGSATLPSATG